MPITCWKLTLLCGLLACSRGSGISKRDGAADTRPTGLDEQVALIEDASVGDGYGGVDSASSPEVACRTDKIAFSQDTGCRNDNAVEFCLPANDTEALSQVKGIAPSVRCLQGSRGRAGCKPGAEQLCQLPIPRAQCPMDGPMPVDLWRAVCRLATLDTVTRIVPTWYE